MLFGQVNKVLVLVFSGLFLQSIEGQEEEEPEWPVVIDPFPDTDEIGPEPEPTPAPEPDCTSACQERIDEVNSQMSALQQQLNEANATLFDRIINLESNSGGGGGGGDGGLSQRVSDLEAYLPANVSMLMDKINADVGALNTQLTDEITTLRQDLETKIDNSGGGGGGGDGGARATEVYLNLTERINTLEGGKIQHLITDNNLWRQNFRVVNATFTKLRKSSRSNTVILQG